MRLTTYTDYALRTLMYLAANRNRLVTIQDVADAHGIAKNHLTKVVHQLGILGFVDSLRGRKGGLRLGREPDQINIGEVIRSTEPDFYMAECFNPGKNYCMLSPACALKVLLNDATTAYLKVLDGVTLAYLMTTTGLLGNAEPTFKSLAIRLQPGIPRPAQIPETLNRLEAATPAAGS